MVPARMGPQPPRGPPPAAHGGGSAPPRPSAGAPGSCVQSPESGVAPGSGKRRIGGSQRSKLIIYYLTPRGQAPQGGSDDSCNHQKIALKESALLCIHIPVHMIICWGAMGMGMAMHGLARPSPDMTRFSPPRPSPLLPSSLSRPRTSIMRCTRGLGGTSRDGRRGLSGCRGPVDDGAWLQADSSNMMIMVTGCYR